MGSKEYIAVLDYDHLDNGMFLSAFANALSQQRTGAGIILHGDSAYTDRLIQTGLMREEAKKRAVRDLNHRLIALLADNGVSAIGLNGFQRELVSKSGNQLRVDSEQVTRLPSSAFLVLSNLVQMKNPDRYETVPVHTLANVLSRQLNIGEIIVFSLEERDEIIREEVDGNRSASAGKHPKVPSDFKNADFRFQLTSTASFSKFPDMSPTTLING